jgi:pyocin large subunit-like protein
MSSPPLKAPRVVRALAMLVVIAAIVVRFWPHGHPGAPARGAAGGPGTAAPVTDAQAQAPEAVPPMPPVRERVPPAQKPRYSASIGFASREKLEEHFHKHGDEVRARSAEEYLRMAQALRDAPAGDSVLEMVRVDHVISRFDRSAGTFVAFDEDGTIRTFFHPFDGERYFLRQASRPHGGD